MMQIVISPSNFFNEIVRTEIQPKCIIFSETIIAPFKFQLEKILYVLNKKLNVDYFIV